MYAVMVKQHGGAEALERVIVPEPELLPGQVRVRMTHVGLNHLDVWVRRGVAGHRFPLPLIVGSDGVGVREDTGELVALAPFTSCGQCEACAAGHQDRCRAFRIRGEGMDGTCAQWVAAYPYELLSIGGLAPYEAASMPLSLLTAYHMLVARARLAPGDKVLVQSGAGGVGSLAIQVAVACGARVVATASTPAKRERCLALGAEHAWSLDELRGGVRAWTGGAGVDVVVEHVGGTTWDASLRAARWGGTVVTCGATAGHLVELDLRALFFKQLSLLGSTMGSRDDLRRAWELALSGRVKPLVDRVLPMSELGEAHRLLEERQVIGKVVIALE